MQLSDWEIRFNLEVELHEIYVHRFLFMLGIGLVSIFLPLYLHEQDFTLAQVALFFLIQYATSLAVVWPAANVTTRIGYKRMSFLSSPFLLLFYLLLRGVSAPGVSAYLLAVLVGAGFTIYWIGMNAEMARGSDREKREEETGYFLSLPMMASAISPFLGGLVVALLGFPALFLLAAVVVAVSYVPFLFSREHYTGMGVDPHHFFRRDHLLPFLTYYLNGVRSMGRKVVWPLYLAVVVTGALNIGTAGSLMAVGAALAGIVFGRAITDENRRWVITGAGALFGMTFLAMAFVGTPLDAFLVAFANGALSFSLVIPIYSYVLDHAEEEDVLEYFAFREVGLLLGRLTVLTAAILLFMTTPPRQAFAWTFAAFAASVAALIILGRCITAPRTDYRPRSA